MAWEEVIAELKRIASEYKDGVPVEIVPAPAKPDFKLFLHGATVFKNDKGEMCAMHHDYIKWLKKIWYKGFEIPMNVYANFAGQNK